MSIQQIFYESVTLIDNTWAVFLLREIGVLLLFVLFLFFNAKYLHYDELENCFCSTVRRRKYTVEYEIKILACNEYLSIF